MQDESVTLALSDILPSDRSLLSILKDKNIKNRSEWWAWMAREYGAVKSGVVSVNSQGYADTAVKFPSRESYMRYCLQCM